ncbi:MAG TPA: CBS domain-containing protein [Vicinamibacteria bacterium]|nr:CBS domain-containing protein [Vicinamibacteria bacterium]
MKTIGAVVKGREVFFLRGEQTVREASRYMTERRVGAAAVLEGTRLAGVLSERDIMGRVVAKGLDPDATKVGDVMTKELIVAEITESHEDGVRKMKQAGCRHLPVVDGGQLVGMVSLRDLLQVDLTEKDEEIRWLNAYIHYTPPEAPS